MGKGDKLNLEKSYEKTDFSISVKDQGSWVKVYEDNSDYNHDDEKVKTICCIIAFTFFLN